jgi:predicted DNA-binding transcriptional regulator AlpA
MMPNTLIEVPNWDQLIADPSLIDALSPATAKRLWLDLQPAEKQLALRMSMVEAHQEADRLLDVEAAAAILSKTPDWLYRRAQTLPFTVREGRLVRFSQQGIQKYIRQRCKA